MSTGADCRFTEFEPGRWRYELQRYPYGASDDYDAYGPFRSYREADDHLQENHANPGGAMVNVHPTDHVHEWVDDAYVSRPVGVQVEVAIESLGPEPTAEQVLGLLASGTLKVEHLRIYPRYRETQARACGACRKEA